MSREEGPPGQTVAQTVRLRRGIWGVLRCLAGIALAFQVALALFTLAAGLFFGGPVITIRGTSMEPAIDRGSVVVESEPDAASLAPGQIVTFADGPELITHRVVEHDEQRVVTKGDANSELDANPVAPEAIIGLGRVVVPWVGWPNLWWTEGRWGWLTLWFGGLLLAFVLVRQWLTTEPAPTDPTPTEPPRLDGKADPRMGVA